jgi:hypothetical protein
MIEKLLIVACGLRACADLLENIRSDSEYGLATASFIGYGHLEPLDFQEKSNLIKNAV